MNTYVKALIGSSVFLLILAAIPLLKYGALRPCGILAAEVQQQYLKELLKENSSTAVGFGMAVGPAVIARMVETLQVDQCLVGLVRLYRGEQLFTGAHVQKESVQVGTPSWTYDERPDTIGRGTIKAAMIQSTNTVSFDWPYGGPQRATFTLRTRGGERDLILRLPKAHFLCHSYDDNCRLTVRIDAGMPQSFRAVGPDDHSTSTLFIEGYDELVPQLQKGTTMRIEANFYQGGRRMVEFAVAGLNWEMPTNAAQKRRAKWN